jgi:hypothetical protein
MMDVVCSAAMPSPMVHTAAKLFDDFQEAELTVRELVALFQSAGLQEHWSAATHLPPSCLS